MFHRVSEDMGCPYPQPLPRIPSHPRKAGKALVMPLVLRISMGSGNCLLSGHTVKENTYTVPFVIISYKYNMYDVVVLSQIVYCRKLYYLRHILKV